MGRGKRVWVARGIVLAAVVAAGAAVGVVVLTGAAGTSGPATARSPTPPSRCPSSPPPGTRATTRGMYALIAAARPRARAVLAIRRLLQGRGDGRDHARPAPVGRARRHGDVVSLVMSVATRMFGRVSEPMSVPVVADASRPAGVLDAALTFPGLETGEHLAEPRRRPAGRGAKILDFTGHVLAEGPATARTYPQGPAFGLVTGVREGARAGRRRRTRSGPAGRRPSRTARAASSARSTRSWPARRASCCGRSRRATGEARGRGAGRGRSRGT